MGRCFLLESIKREWFSNISRDLLAGLVVALALIPGAIGFSLIAGVDPMIGFYASFCMAIIISFAGGRPGMISAAAGAMALVLGGLVRKHGLEYMFAATVLTGIIQIILSFLRAGSLTKFIPTSVMHGFLNALAILIFTSQLSSFHGESWPMYLMAIGGLAIIYLFPRINKTVPSPIIAIVVISIISVFMKTDVATVGGLGNISGTLPKFLIPEVAFSLNTLKIILPYSISLAFVGLIESLLTAQVLDDMTETTSNKNRECFGQGFANIVLGFFGGMAGCALIGQSIVNIKSGGRTRLSTLMSGIYLMIMILTLGKIVALIPIAALVAVMIMVAISTFDWNSLTQIRTIPITGTLVMIATVVVVLGTNNLVIGVLVGVILNKMLEKFIPLEWGIKPQCPKTSIISSTD